MSRFTSTLTSSTDCTDSNSAVGAHSTTSSTTHMTNTVPNFLSISVKWTTKEYSVTVLLYVVLDCGISFENSPGNGTVLYTCMQLTQTILELSYTPSFVCLTGLFCSQHCSQHIAHRMQLWHDTKFFHFELILLFSSNTGRFIMFSVITNIYNRKLKGSTIMEFFTATGKLKKF
jgi:hypothetical protein